MTEIRSEFGEPWERKISENGPDGRLLAYVSSDRFRILMDKIGDPPDVYMLTDRIIACVNFLAGVPTEELIGSTFEDKIHEAAQRGHETV